jgi:hypothetical protein
MISFFKYFRVKLPHFRNISQEIFTIIRWIHQYKTLIYYNELFYTTSRMNWPKQVHPERHSQMFCIKHVKASWNVIKLIVQSGIIGINTIPLSWHAVISLQWAVGHSTFKLRVAGSSFKIFLWQYISDTLCTWEKISWHALYKGLMWNSVRAGQRNGPQNLPWCPNAKIPFHHGKMSVPPW